MSDAYPWPRGNGRTLVISTVVLVVAAAVVLVLGIQDARLLRLGLVAALWAALLGAFATAQKRREISSRADQADQLRTVYQLELEREVVARREQALTVERELREQAEVSQCREIMELRTELAAMRMGLEQLLGCDPLVAGVTVCAESTRLLSLPAQHGSVDDSRSPAPAMLTATPNFPEAEFQFGPGSSSASTLVSTPSSEGAQRSHGQRRYASHHNGSRPGSSGPLPASGQATAMVAPPQPQRTVSDLLAAHGAGSTPGRRRRHQNGSVT